MGWTIMAKAFMGPLHVSCWPADWVLARQLQLVPRCMLQQCLIPKTLKWKDGETVRLSCTKQMGSARSSMRTMHPFHCPSETLILRQFGGQSQCCLFGFSVNSQSHPYKSLNKPNLSWSRARRVISYRCALIGEEMRAIHCPSVR